MTRDAQEVEALTHRVIGCAIEVHRVLGPGLLEGIYRECLTQELNDHRILVKPEQRVPVDYKGRRIRSELKLDLLIEGCIVVELKSVERLHRIHLAQVITYLKLTGCPAGLLMNFNVTSLRAGLKRLSHPDQHLKSVGNSKSMSCG
jgi:GxxExxY protein